MNLSRSSATRWSIDLTGPNQAQWDAGQRWARCNITLPGIESLGDDDLLPFGAAPETATQPRCFSKEGDQIEFENCRLNTSWVFSHNLIPIGELLDDPGTYPSDSSSRNDLIEPACRKLTKSAVLKKYRPLTDDRISWRFRTPDGMSDDEAWNSGEYEVRCYFPYFAYKA